MVGNREMVVVQQMFGDKVTRELTRELSRLVILSETKNLRPMREILRFTQNDKHSLQMSVCSTDGLAETRRV